MEIVHERILVTHAEIGADAADGHVDLRHLPGVGIGLLAEDRDIAAVAAVGLDELEGLREHAARAAAGIVDAFAGFGTQHLDERLDDALRRIVFAALLALVFGELLDAVFVGAPEEVAVLLDVAELQVVGEEVDDVAEHLLVDVGRRIELRQYALEIGVLLLDLAHRVVDGLPVLRLVRNRGDPLPAGALRDEEDVLLEVGIAVLLIAEALRLQFVIALLKGIGNVAQEKKPHQHLTILCRRQFAAHQFRRVPELVLKAQRCARRKQICLFCLCHQ